MNVLQKILHLEQDAEAFGFRWENPEQIMAQIQSECVEINEHLQVGVAQANRHELQEEIGDLLHAVFSLCVFCNMNPQETLEKTLNKFERRLTEVKAIALQDNLTSLKGYPFDELMRIWEQAKDRVG
jgi:uncharacterized protein YabN with tetrapyrrole methylase and pyrophosphatase domain